MKHKFNSVLEKFDSDLWYFYFKVPNDIAEKLIDKDRRVICSVNNKIEYSCAIMHGSMGDFFININKEYRKKLKINDGDEIEVTLVKDTSKYGMPMPEEFEEILYQDPEGDKIFHSLTPGKQRTLIHLVGKIKSSQIRINKALTIIDYLKEVSGNLDYKELNEAFKNSRFK